jgi:glycerol kinase
MSSLLMAIDQGTTGTQVAFFELETLRPLANAKSEFPQHFPKPGWVEHKPDEIWASLERAYGSARQSLASLHPLLSGSPVAALGITNQRETCLAWDKVSGQALHNALVWQDRRTEGFCSSLKANETQRQSILSKTGLVCDPYFSASKMRWLLQNCENVQKSASQKQLALGTIDAWLLWKITRGKTFATDDTNASRTQLYNLQTRSYDEELLDLFGIPKETLPEIRPSLGSFGTTQSFLDLPDGTPVLCILGDQQSALYGQDCESPGEAKITFGTGAFLLAHTGMQISLADDGLLTTVALTQQGKVPQFAREGSAFIAGAAIQFARDNLKFLTKATEIEHRIQGVTRDPELFFIPALAGLPAPWWNAKARGTLLGMSRGTSQEQILIAFLEAIAFQNAVLMETLLRSSGSILTECAVDGGASQNQHLMQLQSDVLQCTLRRPAFVETTSRGVAKGARKMLGLPELKKENQQCDYFKPQQSKQAAFELIKRWKNAADFLHRWSSENENSH